MLSKFPARPIIRLSGSVRFGPVFLVIRSGPTFSNKRYLPYTNYISLSIILHSVLQFHSSDTSTSHLHMHNCYGCSRSSLSLSRSLVSFSLTLLFVFASIAKKKYRRSWSSVMQESIDIDWERNRYLKASLL